MKLNLIFFGLLLAASSTFAQVVTWRRIAETNPPRVALAPLRYLASDELKGRGFDRPEINVAAAYVAGQFKHFGVKPVDGATDYFQHFTLKMLTAGTDGNVAIGSMNFKPGTEALQYSPNDVKIEGQLIYFGHSSADEMAKADIKGKIVMMDIGLGDDASGSKDFRNLPVLVDILVKQGAIGLVERANGGATLWDDIKNYFTGARPESTLPNAGFPFIILKNTEVLRSALTFGFKADCNINISGMQTKEVRLKNVIGYVRGTDQKLKKQYILLTSHYDHLGVAKMPKMEDGKLDSIYNGARDNACGTTAVIDAARYFAKYPPKRSVLFITYTAEEEGLLGSEYYAAHPLIPLNKTVYNLNIDNASYNDTSLITLVGLGRTTADSAIVKACRTYGMRVNNDPLGGALFAESDNYPLANKGIPAPTYSLGMKTFDTTITNRYHQLSDEVGNMDLTYVMRFIKAYILSAKLIADDPAQPGWTKNDPLEKEWIKLFKN